MDDFLRPLIIDGSKLCHLAVDFRDTYRHLALRSTDQFLATPVTLPTGAERGTFLAIDVGGSNLRASFIYLADPGVAHSSIHQRFESSWSIEDHLKMDKPEDLFAWIGDCIAKVVSDYVADASDTPGAAVLDKIPLGICFSFPMQQSSISQATLMPMGKGFAITPNLDLGELLLAGYDRHSGGRTTHSDGVNGSRGDARAPLPPIEIVAITNDTVATLTSLAFEAASTRDKRVAMGLIVGTGTNASIPLKLGDLHEAKRKSLTLPPSLDHSDAIVVVNTEWTINGSAAPLHKHNLVTKWDVELDRCCEAPGFQPFEYMTGGRYLGELVRLVVLDYLLVNSGRPMVDLPELLRTRNAVTTLFLSKTVATAASPEALRAKLTLRLPPPTSSSWSWTEQSALFFMRATQSIQVRSAALISAAVVGLLACAGELDVKLPGDGDGLAQSHAESSEDLIVAYTGSTITHYPGFRVSCQNSIDALVMRLTAGTGAKRVCLREAKDGGVVGAGVIAGTVWKS